jgi:hypothetical protein
MTKTLGATLIRLYSETAGMFFPISAEDQPKLAEDLGADPFVGNALNSFTCSMYHSYGMWLAPLTAALAMLRYCHFKHVRPIPIGDDVGREGIGTSEDGGVGEGDSTASVGDNN